MSARKLGRSLRNLGVVAALACLGWWAVFYSEVIRRTGSKDQLSDFAGCLLVDSTPCTIIKAVAKLAGYTPYEPFAMWGAGAVFVLGALIANARSRRR